MNNKEKQRCFENGICPECKSPNIKKRFQLESWKYKCNDCGEKINIGLYIPTDQPKTVQQQNEELADDFKIKRAQFDKLERELIDLIGETGNQLLMDKWLEWMETRNWLNQNAVNAMIAMSLKDKRKKVEAKRDAGGNGKK